MCVTRSTGTRGTSGPVVSTSAAAVVHSRVLTSGLLVCEVSGLFLGGGGGGGIHVNSSLDSPGSVGAGDTHSVSSRDSVESSDDVASSVPRVTSSTSMFPAAGALGSPGDVSGDPALDPLEHRGVHERRLFISL